MKTENLKPMEELADLIIESFQKDEESDVENFEVYAKELRGHLLADPQKFRAQFVKGYQTLLEELGKEV